MSTLKQNLPFLHGANDRITGVKNTDGSESNFVYTDGSSGPVAITDATAATSTTTGALRVTGGISTQGALRTGENAVINGVTVGRGNAAAATDSVVVGMDALVNNISAKEIVAIGTTAISNINSGSGIVAIGRSVGRWRGAGFDLLQSATNTVLIGFDARCAGNSQTNQVVIGGASALGDGSNTTVIGNTSTTSTRLAGTATSRFEISGDTMRITGTRTPASNAAGTAGDFAFGTDAGTTYLYYCIASGNWGRVALTTGY